MQEIEGGEYNYLGLSGFTNEIFKIQIDGLPKFYGMAEIKKLFNNKMKIEASKIKVIRNGWPLAYVCFKNEEARANALLKINGYIWKNCTLSVSVIFLVISCIRLKFNIINLYL